MNASQYSLAEEMELTAEAEMLNEAWEAGDAVNCMSCGKLVMVCEAVLVDDYNDETACHTGCFNQAKLDLACGNGPHPDDEHRLLHSEYGFSK